MNANDILLLGLKKRVAAVCRTDGSIFWMTELEGGTGSTFVTLVSDLRHVFAACDGVLHCLALQTGEVLWTNPLKGYGYGIGSLCLPGQGVTPPAGAAVQLSAEAAAVATAAGTSAPG